MKKKIMFLSILAVLTLVAISFASAINTQDTTTLKIRKGYSPLFFIRTRKAIREKIGDLLTRFIGQRVFFLPFQWLRNLINEENLLTAWKQQTCIPWCK